MVSGPRKIGENIFKTPRIVAVGDVDIISNNNLTKNNNLNIVLNSFNWALNPEDVEKIPPKNYEYIKLEVSDEVMSGIWQLVIIGIPGFILLFGLLVLVRRRL